MPPGRKQCHLPWAEPAERCPHRAWVAETVCSKPNPHLLPKCDQRQHRRGEPLPPPPPAGQTCPVARPNDLRNAKYSPRNGTAAVPFLLTRPHPSPLSVPHQRHERGRCSRIPAKYGTPLHHQHQASRSEGDRREHPVSVRPPQHPGASLGRWHPRPSSAQSRRIP